MVVTILSAKD